MPYEASLPEFIYERSMLRGNEGERADQARVLLWMWYIVDICVP